METTVQIQKGGSQQQMKIRMGVKNVFLFTDKRTTMFSESDLLLSSGAKNVGWGVS